MRDVKILGAGYAEQLRKYITEEIDGHPLWISRFVKTNPEALEKMMMDFVEAGCDVIDAMTYQSSLSKFMECFNLDETAAYELFKESVRVVKRAITKYLRAHPNAKQPMIAASIGSYGASLHDGSEYTGSFVDGVNMEDVKQWHRPRIAALVEEGVDIIAFCTFPALSEAKAVLSLMKEYPEQKVWVSFQCKDGKHTAYGDDFKEAVKECWKLSPDQLVAVGCNCLNPEFVTPLISGLNQSGKIEYPLVVFPNSGEKFSSELGWHGKNKWDHFDEKVEKWLDLGAKFVGGCCRTDISYVPKIRSATENWLRRNGQ